MAAPKKKKKYTTYMQLRLTAEQKKAIDQAAARDHLDPSVWARKKILDAINGK